MLNILTRKGSHTEFLRSKYKDIYADIVYSSPHHRVSLLKDKQNITRTIAIFSFNCNTSNEMIIKLNADIEKGMLINDAIKLQNAELIRQHISYYKYELSNINTPKNINFYNYGQCLRIYLRKGKSVELYGTLQELYHINNLDSDTLKTIETNEPIHKTSIDSIIDVEILPLLRTKLT